MKSIYKIIFLFFFSVWSNLIFCSVNLNIKIGQMINNQLIEIKKSVSVDYNKEIIIQDESLKDKIVLTLKKFKNVLVNGNKIEPVQINLKTIDTERKISTKTQTVTSFYKNEANFKVASAEADRNDLSIDLEFSEIN